MEDEDPREKISWVTEEMKGRALMTLLGRKFVTAAIMTEMRIGGSGVGAFFCRVFLVGGLENFENNSERESKRD